MRGLVVKYFFEEIETGGSIGLLLAHVVRARNAQPAVLLAAPSAGGSARLEEGLLLLEFASSESLGSREFADVLIRPMQLFVQQRETIMGAGSLGVDAQASLVSTRRIAVAIQFLECLTLVCES